uniref:Uncharacterized protein n=1 Tax=Romanomermis culicivorax TaxID=13658 RepID=A0A915IX46_ROMCU
MFSESELPLESPPPEMVDRRNTRSQKY